MIIVKKAHYSQMTPSKAAGIDEPRVLVAMTLKV